MTNYQQFQRQAALLHMRDVADKTWLRDAATQADLIVVAVLVIAAIIGYFVRMVWA